MDKEKFVKRLKLLRVKHSMSQADIAEALQLNRATVSQWERGARLPSLEVAIALSNVLHVSLDYLVGRSDEQMEDDHSIHDILESASALTPERTKGMQEEAKKMREEWD